MAQLTEEELNVVRGIQYANGGVDWGTVHFPDPDLIAAIHAEWEGKYGPSAE